MTKERKEEIIKTYRRDEKDTGSPEVQVALLTERIKDLTEHLKANPNDNHSRRGLYMMVGSRKKLIKLFSKRRCSKIQRHSSKIRIKKIIL